MRNPIPVINRPSGPPENEGFLSEVYEDEVLGKPEVVTNVIIHDPTRWTWQKSSILKVQYNPNIQQWMEYDQSFANWVRTCVMMHADNSKLESRCSIPDQWREEIGEEIVIVTANLKGPYNPGEKAEVMEGVIHVMV